MANQRKVGIFASYINVALNMFISMFFTPFLISSLGQAEYGVYRIVSSFAGQFAIMSLGISGLVTRNIVYYNTKSEPEKKENFLAMAFSVAMVQFILTIIIGFILCGFSDNIFKNSLTPEELIIAERLIFILIINIGITILSDYFSGIITGHEQYGVSNFSKTVKLILRIVTLVILLKYGFKSISIVLTDMMLSLMLVIFNISYGLGKLKERIKFHFFDKVAFKSSMIYSGAILLQALVNQVNQNLDGVVLGIMTNSKIVAVYSIALVIFNTYASLATVIASVFVPSATRLVARDATPIELTGFVSKIGRYQFMIVGWIVSVFLLYGKEFLGLWLGPEYVPAYKITLILIIPMTIHLIQNSTNAILDAKMKRMGQSIILCIIALMNLIISVVLIKQIGYIGAAYGTAIACILGYGIIINIYYKKAIGLKIFKMYKDIFYKLLPCIIIVMMIGIPFKNLNFIGNEWMMFLLRAGIYSIIYVFVIYIFGMKKNEKEMFKGIINKVLKKGC